MKLVIVTLLFSLFAEGQEIRGRIFYGNSALLGEFKYIVGVQTTRKTSSADLGFCGGALIAPNWIMTAAHCLHDQDDATVYMGSIDRHNAEVSYALTKSHFIIHPQFNPDTFWNDIALILIPKTNKCTGIGFVQLPPAAAPDFVDDVAVIMGWGQIGDHGNLPTRLRWTRVKVMSNAHCNFSYENIIDSDLCVQTANPFGSHCVGDSGGPLVLRANGIAIGIASTVPTVGCEGGNPTVFVRVSSYIPWILSVMGII